MNKAEKTKQLIVEQAAVLFNEKGIEGTSVDDIIAISQHLKVVFTGIFKAKKNSPVSLLIIG